MAAAHRHATFAKGQAEKAKICSWCPAFKSFLFSHARQRRAVAALARTGDLRRDRFSGRRKKWLLPHQTRWLSCDLPRFTGRATKGLACVNRSGTHERATNEPGRSADGTGAGADRLRAVPGLALRGRHRLG